MLCTYMKGLSALSAVYRLVQLSAVYQCKYAVCVSSSVSCGSAR